MIPQRDDVKTRLAPLSARPEVRLIVLFGSVARGQSTAGSDVDLGVIAEGGAQALLPEVMRLLGTDRVDVVDLRRATPLLAMSVARHGMALHEDRRGAFASFVSLALRRFEDTRKLRRLREQALWRYARRVRGEAAGDVVDRELARLRLDRIRENLRLLEPIAQLPPAQYAEDVYRKKAAEKLLQEVVEAAADVNAHVLVESGRPAPDDLYSSFLGLAELGVLDQDLARLLAPSAGLRNRLVHEYEQIDDALVLASLREALDLYPRFIAAVLAFLPRDE